MNARAVRHIAAASLLVTLALAACGQKGPLYLPDTGGEVVTRPAGATQSTPQQTPPQQPSSETAPQPSTTTPQSTTTKPDEKKNPPPR
jgi:predicted small lipoprotein YifL